jgi:hypothetical protein
MQKNRCSSRALATRKARETAAFGFIFLFFALKINTQIIPARLAPSWITHEAPAGARRDRQRLGIIDRITPMIEQARFASRKWAQVWFNAPLAGAGPIDQDCRKVWKWQDPAHAMPAAQRWHDLARIWSHRPGWQSAPRHRQP